MTARFLDVTTEEYHADPCELPSLSSSIACEIIHRSALHAWQIHPKLGGLRREQTAASSGGTLIHALLLGDGEDRLAVLNVSDFRTKAAQEARDAAIAEGKTVIKASDYVEAQSIVETLRKRIAALGITLKGTSEEKIEWQERTPEDGTVFCRGMLDHLVIEAHPMAATIFDVKTTRSADLRSVTRHILEYGYDIQEAAYRSGIARVAPEVEGRIDFVFLFLEIEPPFAVTPVRLDGRWRHIGQAKWESACRTWARCLRTKVWPGYVDQITQVEAPPWAIE